MKSQTRTILYLVTGLILLAGVPASIAYRLGSETRLSPSPEVVWQHFDNSYTPGDFDIYGRLFQANGSPVTAPFMLSTTTDDEMLPDVAANGASQQYLAVWHRYNAAGEGRVVARLRNANGILATPVDVSYAPGWSAQAPAVACDIPGFLIAYEKGSPGWVPYHIYGRLYWPKALYLPLTLRNS